MQHKSAVSTVPKTAIQETDTQSWNWVEADVWTKNMLAALDNGVIGGRWFSLIDKVYSKRTLSKAWQQVKTNQGAAGIDKVSIERFERKYELYLHEVSESLRQGNYQPQPVRRVYIPKAGGKQRPLGIPTVKDRIVQAAIKMVIEPIFEKEFLDMSYGFRPGKGCKDALRAVNNTLKAGDTWVVDADISSYFDTIPHQQLMEHLETKISDGRLLTLISKYLKQDIIDGLEQWTPVTGTPQGAVLSPLLANIYLHSLDELITKTGYQMVRYADDFVILCKSQSQAKDALTIVNQWVQNNQLKLHPDKTHLGNCMVKGQGFEFLGYRFEAGKRFVRRKSIKAFRDKIRLLTKRNRPDSIGSIIQQLNPMLKGWFGYFKHAYRTTFKGIDGFVRRRLRAILRRRHRKTGFGMCISAHRQWPNAYFAKLGLFTTNEAWVKACQS